MFGILAVGISAPSAPPSLPVAAPSGVTKGRWRRRTAPGDTIEGVTIFFFLNFTKNTGERISRKAGRGQGR